jgi:hypothetical protein
MAPVAHTAAQLPEQAGIESFIRAEAASRLGLIRVPGLMGGHLTAASVRSLL